MGIQSKGIIAALACVLAVTFSPVDAHAIKPVAKGTFALSAERLVASNLVFQPGGPDWHNQIFGAPGFATPLDTPRLGADYFIIDGLSLGGHVGIGLYVNNNTQGYLALVPRVGYAFSLTDKIDFWPRVGAGFAVYGPATVGLLAVEGMFLFNLKKYFAIEFGPALDVPFGDSFVDAMLGANAGIVVKF